MLLAPLILQIKSSRIKFIIPYLIMLKSIFPTNMILVLFLIPMIARISPFIKTMIEVMSHYCFFLFPYHFVMLSLESPEFV